MMQHEKNPVKEEDKGLYVFLAFLLFVPSLVWSSFVFMKLWLWFVSEPFNIVGLSLAEALGLILLLSWTKRWKIVLKDDDWTDIVIPFFAPALLLCIGAIARAFL